MKTISFLWQPRVGAPQLLQWEIHSGSKNRMEAFIQYKERKSEPAVSYEATHSEIEREFKIGAPKYKIKIGDSSMPAPQTNRQEGPTNPKCESVHGRRLKE